MRLRSPQEIAFRLQQEVNNVRLWLHPPRIPVEASSPLAGLPDPGPVIDALRPTPFAAEVVQLADLVIAGSYPLLGTVFHLGGEVDWRRDFVSGRTSPLKYFRSVPYLDASQVGDHKVIWELSRHQFLVVLAQAYRFTGRREYLSVIERHLHSWFHQNPYMEGINWCSALEIAFRSLSWMWVFHLAGGDLDADLRTRLLTGLYQHGSYLEYNLSFYFSPNTHLLGEAVALHALGVLFPEWPRSRRWMKSGGRVTQQQLDRQIEADGSHFEQSSYYHVYALDFFLLHWSLAGQMPPPKAVRMAEFLHVLLGSDRAIPLIGDDDGGRLFHPYGDCTRFGRATLATSAIQLGRTDWPFASEDVWPQAAWWLGVPALHVAPQPGSIPPSARFSDTGLVTLATDDIQVLFDAGGFGRGSAGHSHSDALSVIVRRGADEILVDSGTFTYVADPVERDRFRGVAAHNTVRVDGRDQATPATPFRWDEKPDVRLIRSDAVSAEAVCKTATYEHRRSVALEPGRLVIRDSITGGASIEQFWHPGEPAEQIGAATFRIGKSVELVLPVNGRAEVIPGWRSKVYGQKFESPVIRYVPEGREFTAELRFRR
jgi:hypothetical protein